MVKRPFTGDRGFPESPPPLPSLDVFASFPVASTPKKTKAVLFHNVNQEVSELVEATILTISGGPKRNFRFKNPSLSI